LRGMAGNDTIVGGAGQDILTGGEGFDILNAEDGIADRVRCGPGGGRANVDLKDVIDSPAECTQINGAAVDQFPNVAIGRRALRPTPNGRVRVRLICPVEWTPGCTGTLRLRTFKGRGLGKADYSIAPGDSERVRIALNRLGRRLADREGSVRIRAEANELDRNGLPKTTIRTLTLR
jgi:Ca2+-binding RTX toxin-like protein